MNDEKRYFLPCEVLEVLDLEKKEIVPKEEIDPYGKVNLSNPRHCIICFVSSELMKKR